MVIARACVRFDRSAVPAELGGIVVKDGTVEIAVTPLGALRAVEIGEVLGALGGERPKPVEVCVFGVVDEVLHYDDGGGEEKDARLTASLRAGLGGGDAAEVTFYGGAALSCRGLVAPAVGLVVGRGVVRWARGAAHVGCGDRAVVAAAADGAIAAAEAGGVAARRPEWAADGRAARVAAAKLAALRRRREASGAWAAPAAAAAAVRRCRCWRCGDAWVPRGGGGAACASYPLCGGARPPGAAAPGARAFALELLGRDAFRLRAVAAPRGEPRDDPAELRRAAAALAARVGGARPREAGAWPSFAARDLGRVAAALRAAERDGAIRGCRAPRPSVVAALAAPPPPRDGDALAAVPPALRARLAPFQAEGAARALANRRLLLADEMGSGKTLQALAALAGARAAGGWPALVVCPAACRPMWARELEAWLPFLAPGDVRVVRCGLDAPPPPPARTPPVTVVSFHMLERLRELDVDGPFFFRSVVVDEAHEVRSATARPLPADVGESKRTRKVARLLRRATHLALALTGTPSMGRPLGLFALLDALAVGGDVARRGDAGCAPAWFPQASFAERKLAFCREFCGARRRRGAGPPGRAAYDGAAFLGELHALLGATWMLRRLKRDVLAELPPLRRVVVRLEAAAARRGGGGDGGGDDAEGAPAEDAASDFRAAGLAKLTAAAAWVVARLAAGGGGKLVVFAHHVDVMDGLHAALEAARRPPRAGDGDGDAAATWRGGGVLRVDGAAGAGDREAALAAFAADGDRRALLVSVTAGGVGVDLSAACEAVFVEAVGLPAAWLRQAEDRLHRRGQRRAVAAFYLLGDAGSWDEGQWPRVAADLEVSSGLVNGEGRAETLDVDGVGDDCAAAAAAPPPPEAPPPPAAPPPPPPDRAAWAWALDDDSDGDAEDGAAEDGDAEDGGLYFEASPHGGRVHVHGARDGSRHLGVSAAPEDLFYVRRAAARGGAAAAAAAAAARLPAALARDGAAVRDAWRFARDWAALTSRQRADLFHVCARPPLAAAVAAVHVARARAAGSSFRRYTPRDELLGLAAGPGATCAVRLRHREALGLPPIVQAVRPGAAKCLACPAYYACAPRAPGAYEGALAELFCSDGCRGAYAAASGASLRRAVFARDGGVCAACGADGHGLVEALRALKRAPYGRRYALALARNPNWADRPRLLARLLDRPADGLAWEADHAVRVADGGGEATPDAVQTLCVPCHKAKTAREATAAAKRRRTAPPPARAGPAPPPGAALAALRAGDDDDSWM